MSLPIRAAGTPHRCTRESPHILGVRSQMKLIEDLGTRRDLKGNTSRYGLFACPHCGVTCERRYSNGIRAKSCGCRKNEKLYEKGRKYITSDCEICGLSYEQQYRLFLKAKWKNRCPEQRKKMKLAGGKWIAVSWTQKHGGGPTEQCAKCGKPIWRGSTHCKTCAQKGTSKDGSKIEKKYCTGCGVEISRQAQKYCLKCWNKEQDKGLSRERTKFTLSKEWAAARTECFVRDNYTCQHCGARNEKGRGGTIVLNAHHFEPYRNAPALRLELSNLITLCDSCHLDVHREDRGEDRGEDRANTKLTANKVLQIKELLAEGLRQKDIAKLFSISQPTVSHITAGRTWSHVEADF